ncbi:hypothetical protein GGR58DRAFT_524938 [Xylaria digitata]|nr:hypothetical protein GGR58DRAFT_524938 [Xylaria digitata]
MDSVIGWIQQGEEQDAYRYSLNTNGPLDQTNTQFQPAVSPVNSNSLEIFPSTEPEESFDFSFDDVLCDEIYDRVVPSPGNSNPPMHNPFPPNPYSQPHFSASLGLTFLCPQSHTHPAWPRNGLLHLLKHKEKDGFDIDIAPGTSGRQRQALLPGIVPSAATQPPIRAHDSHFTAEIQCLPTEVSDVCPTDPDETTRALRLENIRLKRLLSLEYNSSTDYHYQKSKERRAEQWSRSRDTIWETTNSCSFSSVASAPARINSLDGGGKLSKYCVESSCTKRPPPPEESPYAAPLSRSDKHRNKRRSLNRANQSPSRLLLRLSEYQVSGMFEVGAEIAAAKEAAEEMPPLGHQMGSFVVPLDSI